MKKQISNFPLFGHLTSQITASEKLSQVYPAQIWLLLISRFLQAIHTLSLVYIHLQNLALQVFQMCAHKHASQET